MNVMVVPARGGMGSSVETQANAVAAEIARRLGGHHRIMHLPDALDAQALQEMMKLPEVKETLDLLQRADLVVHGIGRADALTDWRNVPLSEKRDILSAGAVGEAFGHYFDIDGNAVCPSSAIGIDIAQYKRIDEVIAVAGGASKAEAIIAVSRIRPGMVLMTDESAARAIIGKLNHK